VLELGCGDGTNLLPMAYYRRHASFVGLDGARSQVEIAEARRSALGLANLRFILADFRAADVHVEGRFDYIIAHGVFSWVPHGARDALLALVARRLRRGGLLYLNYNTKPGWNVRGLVREFLMAQCAGVPDLGNRAAQAQAVAARLVAPLAAAEHPFSHLLADEFRHVCEGCTPYVAHEYLAPENHAYWRSEFLALARRHGLDDVADADYNYYAGRVAQDFAPKLVEAQLTGRSVEDTADLLCYRQLHSPILTRGPFTRRPPESEEFARLCVASCLAPVDGNGGDSMFQHPSGYRVEAKEEPLRAALERLHPLWPRGLRAGELLPDVGRVAEDLKLLQRNGLIELRCVEPGDFGPSPAPLNEREASWSGYATTPYHTVHSVPAPARGRVVDRAEAIGLPPDVGRDDDGTGESDSV
jgi:SAM-dependent methyltransferase